MAPLTATTIVTRRRHFEKLLPALCFIALSPFSCGVVD
jgi:hypothetical protein